MQDTGWPLRLMSPTAVTKPPKPRPVATKHLLVAWEEISTVKSPLLCTSLSETWNQGGKNCLKPKLRVLSARRLKAAQSPVIVKEPPPSSLAHISFQS